MEGLFQPMHLLVIFIIAIFIFGPRRLPEIGKGLGDGIRALKEGLRDDQSKHTTPAANETVTARTDAPPPPQSK